MKKCIKCFLIFALSIFSLFGIIVLLSRTIFKDELIEYAIRLNQEKQKLIKSYYVTEIPVEPENFAEDFKSIHKIVSDNCPLCEQKGYDMDSIFRVISLISPYTPSGHRNHYTCIFPSIFRSCQKCHIACKTHSISYILSACRFYL